MPNSFYTHTGYPSPRTAGSSAALRAELAAIMAGFDKLPSMAGNGGRVVFVNHAASALEASSALAFDASGNASFDGSVSVAGRIFGRVGAFDNRAVADAPSALYLAGMRLDFKEVGAVNNPPATIGASYATVLSVFGWTDSSGGAPVQVSFGDGLAVRRATGASTWGAWRTLWHDGNLTNLSQLANGPGYITASASITGNAATATRLATARNINGVAFDGSGDINVTTVAGNTIWHAGNVDPFRFAGWINSPGAAADSMAANRSAFTYANGAPHVGPIVRFDSAGYDLELNADYRTDGLLSFRVRNGNGDVNAWNAWRTLVHTGGGQQINGSLTVGDLFASGGWLRNTASLTGLYNQTNGNHIYSRWQSSWGITAGGASSGSLAFFQSHETGQKGLVYWDGDGFGLLSSGGGWGVRLNYGSGYAGGTLYGDWDVAGGLTTNAISLPNGSNLGDAINGSPWYGIGRTSSDMYGSGGNQIHLAGYYGLRLRTSSAVMDFYQESISTNVSFGADRLYAGADSGVPGSVTCSGWFRSSGSTGWYSQSYGGGIHMTDSTWVRVYNGKSFWCDGTIITNGGVEVGYRDVPAVSQTAAYTLALSDRGKSVDYSGAGAATITIPSNAAVAFPVGSVVTITNNSTSTVTVAIDSDTLRLAGTTTTGSRTLAPYGVATARKVAATTWIISGAGLS